MPTRSIAAAATPRAVRVGIPPNSSGSMTFSTAVRLGTRLYRWNT
jgi:hypothetical protein